MPAFQTLSEFLREPFGKTDDRDKLAKYQKMYKDEGSKIELSAHTKIKDSFYFHVKIPSKSKEDMNVFYDVVIRFFTDKPDSLKSSHIRDYYIQFFSNSPGFIYNYAVLYKQHGYLIEELYQKLDPRFFDTLPEKSNAKMDISYDKSIYFACMFLSERRFKVLNKFGIALGRKLSPSVFFQEIKDFQTVKIEGELVNMEKKAMKVLDKKMEAIQSMEKGRKERELDNHRKSAVLSTAKNHRTTNIGKITASKATSGARTINRIVKKTARKSTRRT